jgi:hypothetical protein
MALFMARGGIRLAWLYQLFLELNQWAPPCPQARIWTSRFATAKACLPGDYDYVSQIFLREFTGHTVGEMAPCLLMGARDEQAGDARPLELEPALAQAPVTRQSFDLLYWHDSPLGQALRGHFQEQDRLFSRYLEQIVGEHRLILLVDSGWFGSTQAMLMRRFPEREWEGLYFGRWAEAGRDPWHFSRVHGLCCQGEGYDPARPASAILEYRHLIEDLLEIDLPSVEGYRLDPASGMVRALPVQNGLGSAPPRRENSLFAGVAQYFRSCPPRRSGRETTAAAQAAAKLLRDKIWHPSPRDLPALTVGKRSADFGRREATSVTWEPVPLWRIFSKRRQIHQALWSQGQIAREFPRFAYLAQLLYRVSRKVAK